MKSLRITTKSSSPRWPNLSVEVHAWELATSALGHGATVSAIADRAQEIKEAIKRGTLVVLRSDFQSFLNCLLLDSQEESEVETERRLR